ncbi:MAG: CheY-like chemotaxis protein [Verrucomicrobiales bacterium]|jgi:CheY-like chemotaxis protein
MKPDQTNHELRNRIQPRSPILIVEDSPEDYEATIRAFRKCGLANPLMHCSDGDEALDYLYRRGPFEEPESSPVPSIILLDLNMPGTDGREVLSQVKQDDDLKTIPVIILTTSIENRDIESCYKAGANSYVQKPVQLQGFLEAIQRLSDYWFEIVVVPRG